ncbi:CPBP family intramembrane glutamic endopeptidase, partial [Candidatus Dependentiae bacterium]
KPLFWIVFIAIAIACAAFTYKYFSKAIPIINIDIKMDRASALKQADILAKKFGWGPKTYSQAASFDVDQNAKVFVELECGGQKEFINMMEKDLYMPYKWIVRHFKEFEKNETYIKFTHEGKPDGFKEIISEDSPGDNISVEKARTIAETDATKHWNINFEPYKLAESSKEVKKNGRGDHTFVYERTDAKIGTGSYRLKIVVSGDRITEIKHFIKIPESFSNKYKEMRAANNLIAFFASLAFMLLYILGGCLIGLFLLHRQNFVIWKTPLIVGFIVALLFLINQINVLPIAWMGYDTVSSANNFFVSYLLSSFIGFLSKLFLFTVSFMAAESLTRKAFGNRIQFWKIWSKDSANSITVAGKTFGGYLLTTVMLAYVVVTYFMATKFFGWWTPSDEFINPNVLGHYLPWFSSFSAAFTAGFWEECLFRAIPLSCAALLGKKFGKKYWWIAAAFILQAIIFGAAHANYPAQPAYARLVELMLPSFMFAGVYLAFGLLPGVITHFLYDLALMSMPLFASSTSYAWVNQFMIIFLGAIPLLIVIYARIRYGKFKEIKKELLNSSWQPPAKEVKPQTQKVIIQKIINLSPKMLIITAIAGISGILAWAYFTHFTHNATPLHISKNQAVTLAKNEFKKLGITIPDNWQAFEILEGKFDYRYKKPMSLTKTKKATPKPSRRFQHRFIWQQDKDLYKKLLGTYLNAPQWLVRFVTFQDSIQSRSEEYVAYVNKEGKVYRISHKIPEDAEDESISEDKARTIAHSHLVQKFSIDPKNLQEISAKSKKLKNRINWKFIFSDKQACPLEKGHARIVIKVDGNDVSDSYRYIHVPEQWLRQEKNKDNKNNILELICMLMLLSLIMLAIILAGKETTTFSKSHAIAGFLSVFVMFWIIKANMISSIIAKFDPIKPFYAQLFETLGSYLMQILFISGAVGIILGIVCSYRNKFAIPKKINYILASLGVGFAIAGVRSLITFFEPSFQPLWPEFTHIASYIPMINMILSNLLNYIMQTALVLLFAIALNHIYDNWKYNSIAIPAIFFISGLSLTGMYEIESIYFWLLSGSILAIVGLINYLLFIRLDQSSIPLISAIVAIAAITQQAMFRAYSGVVPISLVSAIIIAILAIVWFYKLNK